MANPDILCIEVLFRTDPKLSFARVVRDLTEALAPLGPVGKPVFEASNLVHLPLPALRVSLGWDAETGGGFSHRFFVSTLPLDGGDGDKAADISRTITRKVSQRHGADRQVWHDLVAPLDIASLLALTGRIEAQVGTSRSEALDTLMKIARGETAQPAAEPQAAPALDMTTEAPAEVDADTPLVMLDDEDRPLAVAAPEELGALRDAVFTPRKGALARAHESFSAIAAELQGARVVRQPLASPSNAVGAAVMLGASALWLMSVPGAGTSF